MPPPTRALPEEVVEEILLRLPPHKPESLLRASLASKPWLALVSGARFRRRYAEFHGAPPMLGFLVSWPWSSLGPGNGEPILPFVSTTKFYGRIPDGFEHKDYGVWDCRHGHVLLGEKNALPKKLAVWDPVTGRQRVLQEPAASGLLVEHKSGHLGAAVLCAVSGCDHCACHDGPSQVVFFSLHDDVDGAGFVAQAYVSLPETSDRREPHTDFHRGEWSEPCCGLPIDSAGFIEPYPPVLVKNAIHFMLAYHYEFEEYYGEITSTRILKYDMSSHCLSLIDAPPVAHTSGHSRLMAMEDGSLGFAHAKKLILTIWSREMGSCGVAAWSRSRVISLKDIPPINDPRKICGLLGSIEGNDIIFVYTELGIYKINLKTLRRKKICEGKKLNALIPYMSFYNPQEMVRAADVAR